MIKKHLIPTSTNELAKADLTSAGDISRMPETDNQDHQQAQVFQETKVCENCHAQVNGMYCSQCGQSIESTLKYFWTVILHLLDDIFSFDSRASRTLFPLVFRPGFLTNEYIAGRRVHYVPPLRLYLFISIVFFLTLKFFATSDNSGIFNVNNSNNEQQQISQYLTELEQQKINAPPNELLILNENIEKFTQYQKTLTGNPSLLLKEMTKELVNIEFKKLKTNEHLSPKEQQELSKLTEKIAKLSKGEKIDLPEKVFTLGNSEDGSLTFDFLSKETNEKIDQFANLLAQKAEKAFQEDATPLIQQAIGKLPQLMFVLLPLFAALLKIMFIFSKRLYLEHLTVALHSHSFIFFSILLVELLDLAQSYSKDSYVIIADVSAFLVTILLIWIPIYLFIMQKRVYKQGNLLTLIKFSVIGVSYLLMIFITGTIAFIWGLASI